MNVAHAFTPPVVDALTVRVLVDSRYERFRRLGVYEEAGVVRS